MKTGIQLAIEACHTQEALGDLLGVTRQAISKWEKQGYAPLRRAIEIEAQVGVPRALLIKPSLLSFLDADA